MKIPDPNKEGEEMEVYTPEEYKAKEDAIVAKDAELAAAKAEVDRLSKVNAEKTENFKKLNEMTAEEKATLSAETIEAKRRAEAVENELAGLKTQISTDTQTRITNDKESALSKFHGGDPTLKATLEKNYELINIPGTDTASIMERARLAAAMEAGKVGPGNPIYSVLNGSAPKTQKKNQDEEFMKSDKAKEAQKRMGDKVE